MRHRAEVREEIQFSPQSSTCVISRIRWFDSESEGRGCSIRVVYTCVGGVLSDAVVGRHRRGRPCPVAGWHPGPAAMHEAREGACEMDQLQLVPVPVHRVRDLRARE